MHRLSKCDVHKKLNERNEQNEHNDTIMKAEYVNLEKKNPSAHKNYNEHNEHNEHNDATQ